MTPHETLAALDDAIAQCRRRRAIAIEFTTPRVLGEVGKPIESVGGVVYGYTRVQCERMRAVILAAAAADAGGEA